VSRLGPCDRTTLAHEVLPNVYKHDTWKLKDPAMHKPVHTSIHTG